MPVKTRTTDSRQLAHSLHGKFALQLHHSSDLVVDAAPPIAVFRWRRAFTLCKAPLKKSTSKVRFANDCFSRWISSSSFFSCGFGSLAGFTRPCSWMSFHRYTVRTETPSSLANKPTSLSSLIRFRACSLNSGVLFFHDFHVRGICPPFNGRCDIFECLTFGGQSIIR